MNNPWLTREQFAETNGIARWLACATVSLTGAKPIGRGIPLRDFERRALLTYLQDSKFTYEQALKAQYNIERNQWANNKQFHVSDLFWDAPTVPEELVQERERNAYNRGIVAGKKSAEQAQRIKTAFEDRTAEIETLRAEIHTLRNQNKQLHADREKLAKTVASVMPPFTENTDRIAMPVPFIEMAGL